MTCHCGQPFVKHSGTFSTLVGYGREANGHHHDDNCEKRGYRCAAGHTTLLSVRRRCKELGCDWRGKETCFCTGPKIDAWPEGVPQATDVKEAIEIYEAKEAVNG